MSEFGEPSCWGDESGCNCRWDDLESKALQTQLPHGGVVAVGEKAATPATTDLQQNPQAEVLDSLSGTPLLSKKELERAEILSAIVELNGFGIEQHLERLWGVVRQTVWRRLRRNRKWVRKGPRTYSTETGTMVYEVWGPTKDGAAWWFHNGAIALNMIDSKRPNPLVNLDPGGNATVAGVAVVRDDAGATTATEPALQPVAPENPAVAGRGSGHELNGFYTSGHTCIVEKVRLSADILEAPGDLVEGWTSLELRPHRQTVSGGVYHFRKFSCPVTCGCKGDGWEAELWFKKGIPAHLDVMHHGKIKGLNVPDLCYNVHSRAREILETASAEVGARLLYPGPVDYHLETMDSVDREVLDELVPWGCTVTVMSGRTGLAYQLDKSEWGKKGAADRGHPSLKAWARERLAPEIAERALKVAESYRQEVGELDPRLTAIELTNARLIKALEDSQRIAVGEVEVLQTNTEHLQELRKSRGN